MTMTRIENEDGTEANPNAESRISPQISVSPDFMTTMGI